MELPRTVIAVLAPTSWLCRLKEANRIIESAVSAAYQRQGRRKLHRGISERKGQKDADIEQSSWDCHSPEELVGRSKMKEV